MEQTPNPPSSPAADDLCPFGTDHVELIAGNAGERLLLHERAGPPAIGLQGLEIGGRPRPRAAPRQDHAVLTTPSWSTAAQRPLQPAGDGVKPHPVVDDAEKSRKETTSRGAVKAFAPRRGRTATARWSSAYRDLRRHHPRLRGTQATTACSCRAISVEPCCTAPPSASSTSNTWLERRLGRDEHLVRVLRRGDGLHAADLRRQGHRTEYTALMSKVMSNETGASSS